MGKCDVSSKKRGLVILDVYVLGHCLSLYCSGDWAGVLVLNLLGLGCGVCIGNSDLFYVL